MFSILLICGGPSPERGVSLNSARSVMDHLIDYCKISVLYINDRLQFFPINPDQLYSNTPDDFDFQLKSTPLTGKKLAAYLKKFNLVFPLIHGRYGEDGQIQALLEKLQVPFVGSSSRSCHQAFNKFSFNQFLKKEGFNSLQAFLVKKGDNTNIDCDFVKPWIVKPTSCGSSFGVKIVKNLEELEQALHNIFDSGLDDQAIVEEFAIGSEFTLVVVESPLGEPVPFIPTEVEILTDGFFDYRKKYLPSNATRSYCPPRFSDEIIQSIRDQAKKVFKLLNMRDLIRIDGWVLKTGEILFTDLNPMSGMEQNSFLFQQAAWVGFSHSQLLLYLIKIACKRQKIDCNIRDSSSYGEKKNVYVLFGGDSNERQVSIMSGTNVWLKLLRSDFYKPSPFLLKGDNIWFLPYPYNLSHTVEEINANCEIADTNSARIIPFLMEINKALMQEYETPALPKLYNLESFLDQVKKEKAFVFLALHGGFGEDGSIQLLLEEAGLLFNGSNSNSSRTCMNKYTTAQALSYNNTLLKLEKIKCYLSNNFLVQDNHNIVNYISLIALLPSKAFIIKPMADGCSTGVCTIRNESDLINYIASIKTSKDCTQYYKKTTYIIEPLIEVDMISVGTGQLQVEEKAGWIEMTVGVLGFQGSYYSLNPSITVAAQEVLSLEEKFQGGTGVNLTPPPTSLVTQSQIVLIKKVITEVARQLELDNYARVDIFFNRRSNQLMVIEVNSLPALTPSTVLFHQAIAEEPSIKPKKFLENIITNVFLEKNML